MSTGGANADRAQVREVVCTSEFLWPCEWAVEVVMCESEGIAEIISPNGLYVGWWQVGQGSQDPYINTQQAYKQFLEWVRGERLYSPWPNCPRRP